MRNLAVILARSGSKGLKDKNIKELNGKPLMVYTIEAAVDSEKYDTVHVSTDSERYAQIARDFGADVPFLRSADLAGDRASSWDALRSVVKEYENRGKTFDTVTLLQPTSPLRNADDIRGAFELFEEKQADSVVSVCEVDHSPLLCNVLDDSLSMDGFLDMSKVGRRQELSTYYRINGAIYIQKTKFLMEGASVYGEKSYAYIMDKRKSIDIDDEYDFMIAESLMKKIF